MTDEVKKLKLIKSSRPEPQEILKDSETESRDTVSVNTVYLTVFDNDFNIKVGFLLNIIKIILHSSIQNTNWFNIFLVH